MITKYDNYAIIQLEWSYLLSFLLTYFLNYLLTYLLTYLLHAAKAFFWHLVKKFPAFYGTRICAWHLSLSWARLIHSIPPHLTSNTVPFTMIWSVLSLQKEERPAIWRVVANILKKQWQTAEMLWSCSLGFGRNVNFSLLYNPILVQNVETK